MSGSVQLKKDFQIALLIEDIAEAKIISDGLREIGIFAHYYQELDDLWVSLNTYTPDLCIVDVKKMSQGTLLFKQHQKVKNNTLKFAFYYKDETKVLLNSCFGLNHYGYLRAEVNIVEQLRSILRRRNEELRLLDLTETMEGRVNRLKLRSQRLSEQEEKNSQYISQNNEAQMLMNKFGKVSNIDDLNSRIITLFSEWDACLEFGLYQLNSTNQKLVSPRKSTPKYRALPDLWLATVCEEGISEYAQEMVYDVSYGVMGDKIITLKIHGTNDLPEMLLVASFQDKYLENIQWEMLENKLSSEFRKVLANYYRKDERKTFSDSIFSTMQNMDDIAFHKVESKMRYAMVDFSSLVNMIKQRSGNRFYWQAFAKEFTTELASILSGDFRISHFGVEHFIVGIDKKFIETDYQKLTSFVDDFQFWRYFEDSSLVVSNDLAPYVKFIAPSSVNLIRQAAHDVVDFMHRETPNPGRQIEV